MTRLSLAIPSKGRLREPTWNLLQAAGLAPEDLGERVLSVPCRNADVDVLFVRADDVAEYVRDGVVDCGVTGLDLVAEREADVATLLPLDYGHCALHAAVPFENEATSLADLNGLRVATSHPVIAARALAAVGATAELIPVRGSVEIAPRLALADAIIDLVSTGSTLRTNGLRSLGSIFESEAVVIARASTATRDDVRALVTMLRSVLTARANRYLMCNVSSTQLAALTAALPTKGSPSVMPLADSDLVAVHALVPAKDVWSLLPRLEALGASAILTLPVERMVP